MKPLPALRAAAGNNPATLPAIIIDTREQTPLPITRMPVIQKVLYTGDYSLSGFESLFIVERKTIADLLACCIGKNRERFMRELERLRGGRFKRLLIIGTSAEIEQGQYRSRIRSEAVFGTLAAFEVRYDCPVVFAPTPEAGARQIESWAWYYAREQITAMNNLYLPPLPERQNTGI